MALFRKAKYSTLTNVKPQPPPKKKEIPEGVFEKCKNCQKTIYGKEKENHLHLCPECSHHYPMTAWQRIDFLTDDGTFKEVDSGLESLDPLKFEGVAPYIDKLKSSKKKSGMNEAIVCGLAKLNGTLYALGVMDFRFLGGSMGSVVGEKVTRLTELATSKKIPLVIVTASGGARMYEGMLSLMQMAKTSGALHRHAEKRLPYIVIMTNPTTAGVTASYASLGDVIIAEPGALIGFAGPRVIKDTTQAKLPEGFQTAEFLLEKGMIDRIVSRKRLKEELSLLLGYMSKPKND